MIEDDKLGQLLRSDAPSTRDAMFRLSVLERRERQRYERRSVILLAAAATAAIVLWIGFLLAGPLATFLIALLCASLAGACFISVPGALQLLRRLRDLRLPARKS
jgi:hypothetical protein